MTRYTRKQLAKKLGIRPEQVTVLAKKLGVGTRATHRWAFTKDDLFLMQGSLLESNEPAGLTVAQAAEMLHRTERDILDAIRDTDIGARAVDLRGKPYYFTDEDIEVLAEILTGIEHDRYHTPSRRRVGVVLDPETWAWVSNHAREWRVGRGTAAERLLRKGMNDEQYA